MLKQMMKSKAYQAAKLTQKLYNPAFTCEK